jgi:hypothetical protein
MTAATAPNIPEDPVNRLLERLERVKAAGPGRWSARCPGPLHQRGDRNPSLSISVGDDGRALVRCFVGCDLSAIVGAVGLELSDLFPPRPITHAGPIPAHRRPKISDRDLLAVIRREVCIVATAGEELLAGPLALPDLERLRTAVRRLFNVLVEAGRHG